MEDNRKDKELLTFPCTIGIKAIGLATPAFRGIVLDIVQQYCASSDLRKVSVNASNAGKYHSITITIQATGRAQLDSIYQTLSDNPYVIMAL